MTRSVSVPMVVLSPWPVWTTVPAGSDSSRSRMLRRMVGCVAEAAAGGSGPAAEQRVTRQDPTVGYVMEAAAAR